MPWWDYAADTQAKQEDDATLWARSTQATTGPPLPQPRATPRPQPATIPTALPTATAPTPGGSIAGPPASQSAATSTTAPGGDGAAQAWEQSLLDSGTHPAQMLAFRPAPAATPAPPAPQGPPSPASFQGVGASVGGIQPLELGQPAQPPEIAPTPQPQPAPEPMQQQQQASQQGYQQQGAPAPQTGGQQMSAPVGQGGVAPIVEATSTTVTDQGTHSGGPAADIFAPEGSPIYSPVSGEVTAADYSKGGHTATIKGDDGLYYYMAHGAVPFTGGRVEAGQQIGEVGRTGNAADTPAHIHFAITTDGDFTRGVNGGSGNVWPTTAYWAGAGGQGGQPQQSLTALGAQNAGKTDTWTLVDQKAEGAGVPPIVLRSLVLAESGGDPGAIGDHGQSFGLLQAYTKGGRGDGYSPQQLLDPAFNLDLGLKEIKPAYDQAVAEGLTGGALVRRVGELAQRPRADLLDNYVVAYNSLVGGGAPPTTVTEASGGTANRSDQPSQYLDRSQTQNLPGPSLTGLGETPADRSALEPLPQPGQPQENGLRGPEAPIEPLSGQAARSPSLTALAMPQEIVRPFPSVLEMAGNVAGDAGRLLGRWAGGVAQQAIQSPLGQEVSQGLPTVRRDLGILAPQAAEGPSLTALGQPPVPALQQQELQQTVAQTWPLESLVSGPVWSPQGQAAYQSPGGQALTAYSPIGPETVGLVRGALAAARGGPEAVAAGRTMAQTAQIAREGEPAVNAFQRAAPTIGQVADSLVRDGARPSEALARAVSAVGNVAPERVGPILRDVGEPRISEALRVFQGGGLSLDDAAQATIRALRAGPGRAAQPAGAPVRAALRLGSAALGGIAGEQAAPPDASPGERVLWGLGGAAAGYGAARAGEGIVNRFRPAVAAVPKNALEEVEQLANGAATMQRQAPDLAQVVKNVDSTLFHRYGAAYRLGPGIQQTITLRVGGAAGHAQQILHDELTPIVQKAGGTKDLNTYLLAVQTPDITARGMRQVGGLTAERATESLQQLRARVGEARFAQIEQAGRDIWAYTDRNLLAPAVQDGLLSQQAADAMKAANPHYIPHEVLREALGDWKPLAGGGSESLSVSQAGFKLRKGSELAIKSPLEALVERTYEIQMRGGRNAAGLAVADAAMQNPETSGIVRLRGAEQVQQRMSLYQQAGEVRSQAKQLDGLLSRNRQAVSRLYTALSQIERERVQALLAPREGAAGSLASTAAQKVQLGARAQGGKVAQAVEQARAWIAQAPEERLAQLLDPHQPPEVLTGGARKPSVADLKGFVEALVTDQSGFAARLGQMTGRRDAKLAALLNEAEALKSQIATHRDVGGELVQEARNLADVALKPGYVKLSVFRDGIREDYAVPKVLGEAVKQLDAESMDTAMRIFSRLNQVSRLGYTAYSATFMARNVYRDTLERFLRRGRLPIDIQPHAPKLLGPQGKVTSAILEGIVAEITHNQNWSDFMHEGGGYSSMSEAYRGQDVLGEMARDTTYKKAVHLAEHPWQVINKINEALEVGPRIGDYLTYQRAGMARGKAAFLARSGTVDYWEGGTLTKKLNPVVLFLNANFQSVYNAVEPFAGTHTAGERASAAFRYALLATAIGALYEWDKDWTYGPGPKQGQSIRDDIPQYAWDYNWPILLGETTDESGQQVPYYLAPPKPTPLVVPGILIQDYLKWSEGRGSRNALQALGAAVGSLTPFQATSMAFGALPPVIQAPGEILANYSFFRQGPIESQRVQNLPRSERMQPGTSQTAATLANQRLGPLPSLGEVTGLSPVQVEYLGQEVFGGAWNSATAILDRLPDLAQRVLAQAGMAEPPSDRGGPEAGSPTGLARNPLTRGIFSVRGGELDQVRATRRQQAIQAVQQVAIDRLHQTSEWDQADQAQRDALDRAVVQASTQSVDSQLGAEGLPSWMSEAKQGEPPKYRPQAIPGQFRSEYQDSPVLFSQEMARAQTAMEAYRRDPRGMPRPTRRQQLLARVAGRRAGLNPAWVRWSRMQTQQEDQNRALAQSVVAP